jgi:hypothetical protein
MARTPRFPQQRATVLTASLAPIPSMQAAAGQLSAGQGKVAILESLSAIPGSGPSATCNTRALELDAGSKLACVRSHGLELDTSGLSAGASLSMRTEAGDSTIVGIFSFQHTR